MALFYYIYVNLAKKKHPDAIKDHKIRDLRQTREFWYFDIIGSFRLEMFFRWIQEVWFAGSQSLRKWHQANVTADSTQRQLSCIRWQKVHASASGGWI